jgi:hypothetical protein
MATIELRDIVTDADRAAAIVVRRSPRAGSHRSPSPAVSLW